MFALVISDTHISPSVDATEYWKYLGEFCVKNKPDCIIHLGDVADFDSQNWIKSSRGLYTIDEEIDSVADHLFAFENVLADFRKACRKNKHKIYRPKKVLCLGNHDNRNDVGERLKKLFTPWGWEVYDYQNPFQYHGISFTHCLPKGLSDTVCTTAAELLDNYHSSIVCGHSHSKDYAESYRLEDGKKIFAIKCPMFSLSNPTWARGLSNKWSRGWTLINVDTGGFGWFNMENIYGR